MEYVIAAAAGVWMVPFLVAEHRVGGRSGYLLRVVGNLPFLALVVLTWVGRFRFQALAIDLYLVIIVNLVSLVLDEHRKWRARSTGQIS